MGMEWVGSWIWCVKGLVWGRWGGGVMWRGDAERVRCRGYGGVGGVDGYRWIWMWWIGESERVGWSGLVEGLGGGIGWGRGDGMDGYRWMGMG